MVNGRKDGGTDGRTGGRTENRTNKAHLAKTPFYHKVITSVLIPRIGVVGSLAPRL